MRNTFNVLIAAMVLASTVTIASGPVNRASAAGSCPSGQNQAFVNLKATIKHTSYVQVYNGGGAPQIIDTKVVSSGAAGAVTATFCVGYSSTSGWTIRTVPSYMMAPGLNVSISSTAVTTPTTGHILRPAAFYAKSMTVEPTMCRNDNRLDFLKFIASLPVPGLNYAASVGVYVIGGAVPSGTTKCQAFASESAPIAFASSNGATSLQGFSRRYYRYSVKTFCSGTSCYDVDQYDWTFTPY